MEVYQKNEDERTTKSFVANGQLFNEKSGINIKRSALDLYSRHIGLLT